MSVKVMSWVWEHSKADGASLLVLLAIADMASDDGGNSWPSVATLATKARCSERTVQRCLRTLVEAGEMAVQWNAGRKGSNLYRVLMEPDPRQSDTPPDCHPSDTTTPCQPDTGDTQGQEGVTPVSPEPSLNHPSDSLRSSGRRRGKKQPSSDKPTPLGTRLPVPFEITPDMVVWAREHCPLVDGKRETERFCDYWRAIPGARGRKLDWPATWRNWLRKEHDDEMARRARAAPREKPAMNDRLWQQARRGTAS